MLKRILTSGIFWRWGVALPLMVGAFGLSFWLLFLARPTWCKWVYIFQVYHLDKGEEFPDDYYSLREGLLEEFQGLTLAPGDISKREVKINWPNSRDDWPGGKHVIWEFLVEAEDEEDEELPIDEIEYQIFRLLRSPSGYAGIWRTWYRNGRLATYEKFEQGKRTELQLYLPDGECIQREGYVNSLMEGDFVVSERLGQNANYHTGIVYKGRMQAGKAMGKCTAESLVTGMKMEGHYLFGKRHGRWREWGSEGELILDGTYRNGLPWQGNFISSYTHRVVHLRQGRPWNGLFGSVIYKAGKKWRGIGSRKEIKSDRRINQYLWDGKEVSREAYKELTDHFPLPDITGTCRLVGEKTFTLIVGGEAPPFLMPW